MLNRMNSAIQSLRSPSLLWGYGLIGLLGIVSTIGLAFYRSHFPIAHLERSYPFVVFAITAMLVLAILRPLYLVVTLHPSPLRQLGRDILEYRGWLVGCTIALIAIPQALQFSSFIKQTIPLVQPFYADHSIMEFEQSLLGGDAWQFTHSVIGDTATRIIDLLYALWHGVNIALLVWIVVTFDRKFHVRAALTYQLTWLILGGILATMLASVGPCFLEEFTGDPRFAPLMGHLEQLHSHERLYSVRAMGYLLDSRGTDAFGSGISAMPSLHVAIAFLTTLIIFDRTRVLLFRLTAIAYFLVILVGSVHLGWHYLLDGLVAIPLVALIWWACGKFADWLERKAACDSLSKPS